jgi:hypothetical protein
MIIKTNNVARMVVDQWEVTAAEQKELDYIDWGNGADGFRGFRYKGQIYDLGEFVRIVPQGQVGGPFAHYDHTGELKGWDGIATDSYFSGVVVKYRGDTVVVGLVFS